MRAFTLLALCCSIPVIALLSGCVADATLEPPREQRPPTEAAPSPRPAPEHAPEPESAPEPAPSPDAPRVTRAVVTRHADGDTARFLLDNGTEEKVRFIGIDTPEVYGQAETYGKEASAYTAKAIPIGATVWLETDVELRDRYGRLLAYVWLESPRDASDAEVRAKMLNARLVLDGYAQVYTFPPNVRYVDLFTRYQTDAREAYRGLWGLEANPANAPPAASSSAVSPGSPSGSTTVYITKTGEKYHAEGCRHLAKSKIPISLIDAKNSGYEPCKTCRPPG